MPNTAEGLLWVINVTLIKMAMATLSLQNSISQEGSALFLLWTHMFTPSLQAFHIASILVGSHTSV